ncbi:MAG: hypothetical protein WC549_00025 [Actinomycetota bacterium]
MEVESQTVLESPYRSPLVIVEAIKDIIKDKVVCDLGCACGDILIRMKKYAKDVIGVERDIDRAIIARSRFGLNVIKGDILQDSIPEADVYYLWVVTGIVRKVLDRIPRGTVIIGVDCTYNEDKEIEKFGFKGDWITVPFDEGNGWRQKGIFKLLVINK